MENQTEVTIEHDMATGIRLHELLRTARFSNSFPAMCVADASSFTYTLALLPKAMVVQPGPGNARRMAGPEPYIKIFHFLAKGLAYSPLK